MWSAGFLSKPSVAIQSAEHATAALLWIRELNGPFAFSPDGRRIASGSADGSLQIWDITGGVLLAKSPKGHSEAILSIAFSPDSGMLGISAM